MQAISSPAEVDASLSTIAFLFLIKKGVCVCGGGPTNVVSCNNSGEGPVRGIWKYIIHKDTCASFLCWPSRPCHTHFQSENRLLSSSGFLFLFIVAWHSASKRTIRLLVSLCFQFQTCFLGDFYQALFMPALPGTQATSTVWGHACWLLLDVDVNANLSGCLSLCMSLR